MVGMSVHDPILVPRMSVNARGDPRMSGSVRVLGVLAAADAAAVVAADAVVVVAAGVVVTADDATPKIIARARTVKLCAG
jgi:hypothetical protein